MPKFKPINNLSSMAILSFYSNSISAWFSMIEFTSFQPEFLLVSHY